MSSPATPTVASLKAEPFNGGGKWIAGGGAVGLVLLLLTLVGGGMSSPKETFYSYLVAFVYWCGIAFASVILLMCFHATHARWMTILRRPVEAMASSMGIFLLLVIPIFVGMDHLYSWLDPAAAGFSKEAIAKIAHKAPWLNRNFFIARGVLYIGIGSLLAWRLSSWSRQQDREGGAVLLERMRRLSAGGMPFIALALTFAAFDWMMSLNPTWFSTIFGVYWFAGSFGAALSLLAMVTYHAGRHNLFSGGMNVEHTHSIGKLMLAFTAFWTYIAFSQLLLIWIAGLPEETPFYITRFGPGWRGMGVFLIIGHFFAPFGALLSRSLKRNPKYLAITGFCILLVHLVDIYWLIMPTLYPDGVTFHWTQPVAFLGVGGLAIAFGVSRLRGKLPIPMRDPYLAESLRYRQP